MDNKVVFEGTMDSAATAQPDEVHVKPVTLTLQNPLPALLMPSRSHAQLMLIVDIALICAVKGMPADWASALPSMPTSIPSISDVGMLTVAKGYGLAQSRMGPWYAPPASASPPL